MDRETGILLLLVGILAVNQAVTRVPRLQADPRIYWTVQAVDLTMATAIILLGLPGFDHLPGVSAVVGFLFLLHVAQNHSSRISLLEARDRRSERTEIEAEAERLRDTRAPEEDF